MPNIWDDVQYLKYLHIISDNIISDNIISGLLYLNIISGRSTAINGISNNNNNNNKKYNSKKNSEENKHSHVINLL